MCTPYLEGRADHGRGHLITSGLGVPTDARDLVGGKLNACRLEGCCEPIKDSYRDGPLFQYVGKAIHQVEYGIDYLEQLYTIERGIWLYTSWLRNLQNEVMPKEKE